VTGARQRRRPDQESGKECDALWRRRPSNGTRYSMLFNVMG
jgi:hypothetical protein